MKNVKENNLSVNEMTDEEINEFKAFMASRKPAKTVARKVVKTETLGTVKAYDDTIKEPDVNWTKEPTIVQPIAKLESECYIIGCTNHYSPSHSHLCQEHGSQVIEILIKNNKYENGIKQSSLRFFRSDDDNQFFLDKGRFDAFQIYNIKKRMFDFIATNSDLEFEIPEMTTKTKVTGNLFEKILVAAGAINDDFVDQLCDHYKLNKPTKSQKAEFLLTFRVGNQTLKKRIEAVLAVDQND